MKKNKSLKSFVRIALFIVLAIGLSLRSIQPNLFEPFTYYWMLCLFIFIGVLFNFKGIFYFSVAFILFFISAFLTVFGLRDMAEAVMRISLIWWIIGFIKAVFEVL